MAALKAGVDIAELRALFTADDGLLPDITFNFSGARVVATAYAQVQRRASGFGFAGACYWSKTRGTICPIEFSDNPAEELLRGDAEAFRVVFNGLRSPAGNAIPDLGVFLVADDFIALDYRMGLEWSESAIAGLLDLMEEIASLSANTIVTHEGNLMDPDGEILLSAFNRWRMARACRS